MIPLLYVLITSLATIVGGTLPMYTRLRHIEQRCFIAFAGAAMVAIALFDLIPEMETHNPVALLSGLIPTSAFDPLVGFTAGIFLYVGASDLRPEAHRRFNSRIVLATLAGGGLIPVLDVVVGR